MTITIFALSTPPGIGALAIVRLSGPGALGALQSLSGQMNFTPRQATRVILCNHHPGPAVPDHWSGTKPESRYPEQLDDGLAVYFPAPYSFTGEDIVELTLHGGRATTQGVLGALGAMSDLRLAEPGEFTRRAFENGKMDLTQAEAIADLIHAETVQQRQQALSQLSGTLSDLYQGWAARLTALLAHAEADIDFADEDLPADILAAQHQAIEKLISELQEHLSDNRRGERLRDGITIAIVGAPNAGKSTLLNVLAQRDVAIVTDIAGTTRDVLEVHFDLGGYPVTLLDTAGLRETSDVIESEGIRRARERATRADLKLCLFDAGAEPDEATRALIDGSAIVVMTKLETGSWKSDKNPFLAPSLQIPISAHTGAGIAELLQTITQKLEEIFHQPREAPSLTRARHRTALEDAMAALQRAAAAQVPELRAEDLRLALRAIGRITGRVDVEDLLDQIFSEFCIGK